MLVKASLWPAKSHLLGAVVVGATAGIDGVQTSQEKVVKMSFAERLRQMSRNSEQL